MDAAEPAPRDVAQDELGAFRRLFLEWLDGQEAWRRMSRLQRDVISTAILKRLNPEDGLFVGPKRMIEDYRSKGKVSERTIKYAREALRDGKLMEEPIPRERDNGSQATSVWYPPVAFFAWAGLPVPEALAKHLGYGVVVPIRNVVEGVEAASGRH